jgi:hypothetical protein
MNRSPMATSQLHLRAGSVDMKPASLRHSLADKLSAVMKPQDFNCRSCGHQWLGTNSTCPRCDGVAKSDGETTRKTFQGDPGEDLKKGLR